MASYTNEELVSLCLARNEVGWNEFVERFSWLIRHSIKSKILKTRVLFCEGDVDDIFQSTFTKIWQTNSLSELNDPGSLRAYLVIIAQNTTADFLRKRYRLLRRVGSSVDVEMIASQANPRSESHDNQLNSAINEFLNELPIKERRIMTLDLLYDFSHRQISSLMSIPINTVSTIISRTKRLLRDHLKQRGFDDFKDR